MPAETDLVVDGETIARLLTSAEATDGDQTRFILDVLASAPDEALAFLSGHLECHTARGATVDPLLQALRSDARGKRVRAAVALLAARAAEGAGDSVGASDLISEALAHRPDLEPALHDAAQYAAACGDYLAADGYLRRAQLTDPLQPGLTEILTATAVEFPRNSPCPCGSGRKFKTCCRHNATPPLAVRAQLVYALVGSYGERAPGIKIIKPFLDRTGDGERYAMLFLDLVLFPGGLVDKFLAARGHWLRPDERALIDDWRTIPVTLYEAMDVRRGSGVTLRALPDGDPIHLADKLFSQCASRLDLFCGRLLHDGTTPRMLALPAPVARRRRHALTELLASCPSVEQLADFFAPEHRSSCVQ